MCIRDRVTGVPPVVLQLGYKPSIQGSTELEKMKRIEFFQALDKAKKNTKHKLAQRNKYFSQKYNKPIELQPGEIVYIKTHNQSSKEKHYSKKFAPLFEGPFIVKKYQGNNSYLLEDLSSVHFQTQHISNLKF